MNFLIIGYNSKKGYSGGRYHAFILANALIEAGFKVTYWTNNIPQFSSDFSIYNSLNFIKFDLSLRYKLFKKGDYDYVIFIPDMSPNSGLCEKAILTSYVSKAKLVLLNFESPNWFNKYSPIKRSESLWNDWIKIAKYSHIILSSTKESMKFAIEYYKTNSECKFEYCYPSINSKIADLVNLKKIKKENEIIIITRFDKKSLHKGGSVVFNLFDKRLEGYTLKFIIGTKVDNSLKNKLEELSKKSGVKYEFLEKISDKKKFIEIKKSKAMVFLSKFEGFGYPPVESIYVGTKCIAYKLNVFQETCGRCLEYCDLDNLEEIINKLLHIKNNFNVAINCQENIKDKVEFSNFAKSLKKIFCININTKENVLNNNINPYSIFFVLLLNKFTFSIKKIINLKSIFMRDGK